MSTPRSFDDLAASLVAGDSEAKCQVFQRFVTQLIRLASHRLDPRLRAKLDPEDVVQSVFRTFFRRVAEGEFVLTDWDSLWGLLARITARRCCNQNARYRRERRDVGRETQAAPEGLFDRQPTPEDVLLLEDVLGKAQEDLTERDRLVVALWLLGHTAAEIARQVECSERTVFRTQRLITGKLKRIWNEDGDESDGRPSR